MELLHHPGDIIDSPAKNRSRWIFFSQTSRKHINKTTHNPYYCLPQVAAEEQKGFSKKKSLWPNSSSSSSSSHPSLPFGMRKTLRKISSWNGVCSNPHKSQAQNMEEKKRDRRRSEWWALLMRAYLQQLNCFAWLLVCLLAGLFVLLPCLLVCFASLLACLLL